MYCFPRNVDSVAFYTDRDDLKSCRTRVSQELVEELIQRDRSVVLFTHRHSLDTFKQVLPPQLKVTEAMAVKPPGKGGAVLDNLVGDGAWGLCHVAVIERVPNPPPAGEPGASATGAGDLRSLTLPARRMHDLAGRTRRAARTAFSTDPVRPTHAAQAHPALVLYSQKRPPRREITRVPTPLVGRRPVAVLPVTLPAQEPGKSPVLLYVTRPGRRQTGGQRRAGQPDRPGPPAHHARRSPIGEKGDLHAHPHVHEGRQAGHRRARDRRRPAGRHGRVDLTQSSSRTTSRAGGAEEGRPARRIRGFRQEGPKVEPKNDSPAAKKDMPPKKDVKLDVPYVPTPPEMVDKMLEVAGVKEGDVVYDLGSGDGRIVIAAVQKHKAKRGVGIEMAPSACDWPRTNAEKAGVADKIEIRQGDISSSRTCPKPRSSPCNCCRTSTRDCGRSCGRTLKPGARVVSYDFDMGEDWKPEKEVTVKDKDGREHVVYLWTIKEAKNQPKIESIPGVPLKELPKRRAEEGCAAAV